MAPKKPTPPPVPPKRRGALPGERRGGRTKGTPNKRTAYRREQEAKHKARYEKAAAEGRINEDGYEVDEHGRVLGPVFGTTPLDFMRAVMNDRSMPVGFRMDAAHKVAPYIHPKLATVEVKQKSVVVNADASELKKGKKSLSPEDLAKLYKDILDKE